jgi:hypothetical protein
MRHRDNWERKGAAAFDGSCGGGQRGCKSEDKKRNGRGER